MKVLYSDLISRIPEKIFKSAAAEFRVDKSNHKLTGLTLFNILMYNMCEENRISLRVIEENFTRADFRISYKGKELKASKSGIANRIKSIDYRYFEKIFKNIRDEFMAFIPKDMQSKVKKFDSTLVTASGALLKCGFKVPQGSQHQIKFTVGYNGLPISVRFGNESSDVNEDVALRAAIKESSLSEEDIVVFDRGLSSRKTFKEFSELGISFVTRLNDRANYRVIRSNEELVGKSVGRLMLLGDHIVQLRSKQGWVRHELRLIVAEDKKSKKKLFFLTNINHISAEEVTEIYKSRWDIEVFFKFIKQHLNGRHFLSRDENGIKVVFYMLLITATLVLTFKKLNNIDSFRRAKKLFTTLLERSLTYEIVKIYKGNYHQYRHDYQF